MDGDALAPVACILLMAVAVTTVTHPHSAPTAARMPGIDVARALAVLGMVLVDFRSWMGVADGGPQWLRWACNRLEGRAGALFVLLAGVGVALGTRRALDHAGCSATTARVALLKRAGLLLTLGLINLHVWPWDILHCYGAYLALAVLLLTSRGAMLWATAAVLVAGAATLQAAFGYAAVPEQWAPHAMVAHLVFDGLFPVFPWAAFLVVGIWLGRQDLRDRTRRNRILMGALAVTVTAEAIGAATAGLSSGTGRASALADLLCTWPRPPSPGFVFAAGGTAVAMVCLTMTITERRLASSWVRALSAAGQLALTLYLAHVIALLIPAQHGLLQGASLPGAVACGFGFWLLAVVFSVWWRQKCPRGPLEGLALQVTGTAEPACGGGTLVTSSSRPPASQCRVSEVRAGGHER